MPMPAKSYPDKTCPICGKTFNRSRYNGTLEDSGRYLTRVHCSQACANTRLEPTLAGYRARAKRLRGGECAQCGGTTRLHAHHVNGDVTDNRAENIETLCASCHISGHWAEKRTHRLRMLGNAVVPQQAAHAIDLLGGLH